LNSSSIVLLNSAALMAIGAFLMVFGVLLVLFSAAITAELYSSSNYYQDYQVATAYAQLVGVIFGSVGVGFLAYGHGVSAMGTLQSQQSA